MSPPDPEHAAGVLDAHDDYRVLRRLKPRAIDLAYQPGPGESIAVLVDVETTGLDHRRHEVIEIGMVAFVHDAAGRIRPVVGVLGMLHEPRGEISAEITRLTGITARKAAARSCASLASRSACRVDVILASAATRSGGARGSSAPMAASAVRISAALVA